MRIEFDYESDRNQYSGRLKKCLSAVEDELMTQFYGLHGQLDSHESTRLGIVIEEYKQQFEELIEAVDNARVKYGQNGAWE